MKTAPAAPPRPRRRLLRIAGLAGLPALLAGLIALGAPAWLQYRGNFGVVDPGRVYRGAQPHARLEVTLDACRVASVLNLRGGSPADPWYAAEVRATAARGIDFYDVPMSATERPSRRQLLRLLDLLDRCRYPLFIHCKSGADRTGLVSALYLAYRLGEPPRRALGAFSLAYGHVPLFGPDRLHGPLDEYAAWLDARGLPHTPGRLRSWLLTEYRDADPAGVVPPPIRPGPRDPFHEPPR